MITGLDIKGFKKFVHLSIHQLSRVNLVGGRNNIGKTSLLEAIFLFFDRMNPHMVTNQFARRGVSILPLEPETLWAPVFFNYEIKHGISISVTYGKITEKMDITYNPNYLPALVRANKAAASGRQLQIKTDQKPMPSYALDIVYKTNGIKGASHLTVGVEGLGLQVEKMKATKMQATIIPSRYISPPNEDAERYGKLDVAGEENDILEFLRIIEPNLKGLSSVTMGNISMVHGDIGLQRKIPVPYMGEGVAKLLSIILAIANTKGGIVLIDEFENGLHYSVMQKVWEGIGKAAKKYDCQVIATTHSYECLDAAYKGFSGDLKEDFTYLRLDSSNDETKAKIFDYDMLKVAIESNMEVR
jgi:AAA15 family ATPase/GTPase